MLGEPYTKVKAMNKTVYEMGFEKGEQKGLEKGKEDGLREAAQIAIEDAFGPLPAGVIERLSTIPDNRLREIVRRTRTARSLKELGLED
jgi:hypothetical protein